MAFRYSAPLVALLLGAAFLLHPKGARTEAIDGDWCQNDGRNMIIAGGRSSRRAARA